MPPTRATCVSWLHASWSCECDHGESSSRNDDEIRATARCERGATTKNQRQISKLTAPLTTPHSPVSRIGAKAACATACSMCMHAFYRMIAWTHAAWMRILYAFGQARAQPARAPPAARRPPDKARRRKHWTCATGAAPRRFMSRRVWLYVFISLTPKYCLYSSTLMPTEPATRSSANFLSSRSARPATRRRFGPSTRTVSSFL